MATEQHHQSQKRVLKQDGYLELPGAPCKMRNVLYHPQLNVLLLFDCGNLVKVLDANSGVILQTYVLGTNGEEVGEKIATHTHAYMGTGHTHRPSQMSIQWRTAN